MKDNGFIIHEGTKNGEKFAVIATLKTSNRKTGNMIQVWILLADHSPVDGVKSGLDASTICTGCKFASGNGCYVMSDKPLIQYGRLTKLINTATSALSFTLIYSTAERYDLEHMATLA